MINKVKWCLVMAKSIVTSNSVVDLFGCTYVVYGNTVKKVRG
jgi:hypothetical protein